MNKFGLRTRSPATSTESDLVQKILFLAPEWGTITKVGGLADVVASLSQALIKKKFDVRTVLLGYRHIRMQPLHKYFNPELPFFVLEECSHPDYPGHIFYVIKHPALGTVHEPYSPSYSENDSSLDLLQSILLALVPFAIVTDPNISWSPDLIHCHDWLCGLYPYFNHHLETLLPGFSSPQIPCVFTIHNASYMGVFAEISNQDFHNLLQQWGISFSADFQTKSWKYQGKINLLATGLRYAEKINTVSPTHARELLLQHSGISPILQERTTDFCGILNGTDNSNWNSNTDPYLQEFHYQAQKQEVKKAKQFWKRRLGEKLQIAVNPKIPLVISICRIVEQKGLEDLFFLGGNEGESREKEGDGHGPLVDALLQQRCQLIILGEGDSQQELQLQMLAWKCSHSFTFLNYFHEEMAHILTAAADFFIMPSRYEPCGLNQIYSMRYGTIPIVRKTGGLADTVVHKVNGLVFQNSTIRELQTVLNEAFDLWAHRRQFWGMRLRGMEQDFSWNKSLSEYIQLYNDSRMKLQADNKMEQEGST